MLELFRPEVFFAEALFVEVLRAEVFLAEDFLPELFFAELFRAGPFLAELFFAELFLAELFFFAEAEREGAGGTLAPDRRASDRPMAMACLGFLTLRPLPDFSLPFLKAFISRSTEDWAFEPYFLPEAFLAAISAPCAPRVFVNPVTGKRVRRTGLHQ